MEKDEINQKRNENWIEASFMIEVMAVDKKVAEEAIKKHVDKLATEAATYEIEYQDTVEVEKPNPQIEKAYSTICEIKFFVKSIDGLIRLVLLYGPSAAEIIGPNKKEVTINELQNISNTLAGLVHQFASAGAGGIVISPSSKQEKED